MLFALDFVNDRGKQNPGPVIGILLNIDFVVKIRFGNTQCFIVFRY